MINYEMEWKQMIRLNIHFNNFRNLWTSGFNIIIEIEVEFSNKE